MIRVEHWGNRRQNPRGIEVTRQVRIWRSQGNAPQATSIAEGHRYYLGRIGGSQLWQWSSVGRPQFSQTVKTRYHRWELRVGVGAKAYVWQSAGSGGATPVATTAAMRRIGVIVRRRRDLPTVHLEVL